MRRFQFRLESVLRVRAHELDRRRSELEAAVLRATRAAEQLTGARERAEAHAEQLRTRSRSGLRAGELELAQRGARSLYERVGEAEKALAAAEARVLTARAELRAAHVRVRALELLRERAHAAWLHELRRREQAELDEVGARVAGASEGAA